MADGIHRLIRARTRNPDPYRQAKTDATRRALALLPRLRVLVRAAADPLETAVRIAIAGNMVNIAFGLLLGVGGLYFLP